MPLNPITGTENGETLNGTVNGDLMRGLGGNDDLTGRAGNDRLEGGAGDDQLDGSFGDDLLYGGEGNDQLRDFYGSDSLYGEGGDDWLDVAGGDGNRTRLLDGGAGNDYLRSFDRRTTYTGGSGRDGFYVEDAGPGQVVTDFEAGASGDYLDIDVVLARIAGYDGTNPFGTGYLRLRQDGADAVLELDRGLSGAFIEIIRLRDAAAATLVAANFYPPFPPDGSPAAGETIVGTEEAEALDGTIGGDLVQGLGGNDDLNGRAGDDRIEGGGGNDRLDGDFGDDVLDGGDGNDQLRDFSGSDTLYGGDGDDRLDVAGGDGGRERLLDGGDGDDYLRSFDQATTYTGGTGRDGFYVEDAGPGQVVTDFEAGPEGDYLDIDVVLARLPNYDGTNPFGTGHLRLRQDGADTVLELDRGLSGSFVEIIRLLGVSAASLEASNFDPPFPLDGSAAGETIVGTEQGEALTGTVGGDLVQGLGGNDDLNGRGGNDQLEGGEGDDQLDGGFGDDVLFGGDGDDQLRDFYGSDELYGGEGNDWLDVAGGDGGRTRLLDGGAGNDYLRSFDQATTLTGGTGRDGFYVEDAGPGQVVTDFQVGADGDHLDIDTVIARIAGYDGTNPFGTGHLRLRQDGADTLLELDRGLSGAFVEIIRLRGVDATLFTSANLDPGFGTSNSDTIVGGAEDNSVYALAGNDDVSTGGGNDTLFGGAGTDLLQAGDGDDSVDGGLGDDTLVGGSGAGNDLYVGGAGSDTVRYASATLSVLVNLARGLAVGAEIGRDTVRSVEGAVGGAGDDTMVGNAGINELLGGGGNDTLMGGGGGDALNGGLGSNTADYSDMTASVVATAARAAAARVTVGGIAEDTTRYIQNLTGGSAGDRLTGDGQANVLRGGLGADVLDGGAGSDTADFGDKTAAVVIRLNGETTSRAFVGGLAEDTLRNIENVSGGSAADTLSGDGAANLLAGGGGDDRLEGGTGADALTGGLGADTFLFRSVADSTGAAAGRDTVVDFSRARGDVIHLLAIDADADDAGNQAFAFIGAGNFTGVDGQLRVQSASTHTLILGDTDGDRIADFSIKLLSTVSPIASDFVL